MAERENKRTGLSNSGIADALDQVADLLEAQQANAFRIAAYRKGRNGTRPATLVPGRSRSGR